jgi:hypothetical protein
MLVYRPYWSAAAPVGARIAAAELGGAGAVVRYRFVHPLLRDVVDPPSSSFRARVGTSGWWDIPEPPPAMLGPHGEAVIAVNLAF